MGLVAVDFLSQRPSCRRRGRLRLARPRSRHPWGAHHLEARRRQGLRSSRSRSDSSLTGSCRPVSKASPPLSGRLASELPPSAASLCASPEPESRCSHSRSFATAISPSSNFLTLFVYSALAPGSTFYLVLFLQSVVQYTPFEAGLLLLPSTVVLLALAPRFGRLADRFQAKALPRRGTADHGGRHAAVAAGGRS